VRSRPRVGARRPLSEARLEDFGSGLAPLDDGWFVVNVRDAAWMTNEAFGARCTFERSGPLVRRLPELGPLGFPQVGLTLAVLEPGRPSGLYHAETAQEAYLVLVGECLLLVEDDERALCAWDFVHLPPGTTHALVGSDERCVVLMVGARPEGRGIHYPFAEVAQRHGASVERATDSPHEAYERCPDWEPRRPSREALPF
jgi:uncharacterized cupin superfamily protein